MKTDLFGRTEEQLETAIAKGERTYAVAQGYKAGGHHIQELERQQSNIDVDRAMLAELRGEIRPDPARSLSGAALEKWRKDLLRRGRAGMP